MATLTNELKQIYDNYRSYITTQILDSVQDSLSSNLSAKLDTCRQLVIMGSDYPNSVSGQAKIVTNYYDFSIPSSALNNQLTNIFANTPHIQLINLSSHYAALTDNRYSTSDVVRLSFQQPVATSARVLQLLKDTSDLLTSYLKKHNQVYTPYLLEEYPGWLTNEIPHKHLFQDVSAYIDTSLEDHNNSIYAHQIRFKNYYNKTQIDDFNDKLKKLIKTQESNRIKADNNLSAYITETKTNLYNYIDAHKNAQNQPNKGYAHEKIFNKYYRSKKVDQLLQKLRQFVINEFAKHRLNGVRQHTDLAPKINPYFQGNIYLNYNNGTDNVPHGLYIRGMKNDFARFIVNYADINNKDDNGALVISTGDNGTEPIVIQQTIGGVGDTLFKQLKNEAYLLDKNGNTRFPKTVTANQVNASAKITTGIANISNTANINYADINSTVIKNKSYISYRSLPTNDSTTAIPNTQWVQKVVNSKDNTLIKHKTANTNYPLLFIDKNDVTADYRFDHLSKNNNITVNPSTNTITAKNFKGTAHRAKWADLAEIYETDKEYQKGTLVCFGGQKEITAAVTKVNAVISDKPAFLMNQQGIGQPIALIGRVPVLVKGKVNKFDYITISNQPGIGISNGKQYTEKSIAIALEDNNQIQKKLVLCCIQMHI